MDNIKMTLVFDPKARRRRTRMMAQAQDYVDSEALRLMTPYVPVARDSFKNRGRLRDSGAIQEPGSIVYTAPHARDDYYAVKHHKPPAGGNPKGTRLWFEVMKHNHGRAILRGTAKLLGVRAK